MARTVNINDVYFIERLRKYQVFRIKRKADNITSD